MRLPLRPCEKVKDIGGCTEYLNLSHILITGSVDGETEELARGVAVLDDGIIC